MALKLEFTPEVSELSLTQLGNRKFWHFNSVCFVYVNIHCVKAKQIQEWMCFSSVFQSTPLHLAAGYNRVRIVQLLLQHGADVHAKDKGQVEQFISFNGFAHGLLCFVFNILHAEVVEHQAK